MQHQFTRRRFMATTGLGGLALANMAAGQNDTSGVLRFGVIADPHRDIMHDSMERLSAFVEAVKRDAPDFVIQMGDFCQPMPGNDEFLALWDECPCPRYHVIGNHEGDGDGKYRTGGAYAYRTEEIVEYFGMPGPYYSFDVRGTHCIVLDGNNPGPGQKPYYRYIGDEQLEWLEADLASTTLPTIVFSHQPLERSDGVENHEAVRAVLEAAKPKVLACFGGHRHLDYHRVISGILYAMLNSMSNQWLGGDYLHVRYSDEVDEQYPYLKYTAPFRDPLWAFVTTDLGAGTLVIEGRDSEWVGPSPAELGHNSGDESAPRITSKELSFKPRNSGDGA